MAKSQAKTLTNGTAANEVDSMPCYVLSLNLENVRCFGPKQTLDLSKGKGQPAQWTIILGENGTGKTTLLQTLVSFEPVDTSNANSSVQEGLITRFHTRFIAEDLLIRRQAVEARSGLVDVYGISRDENLLIASRGELSIAVGPDLENSISNHGEYNWSLTGSRTSFTTSPSGLQFYAYGAGRRLGGVSLRQNPPDDPVGTLFDENALLRNAEEWLLLLDYTASKESEVQAQQKTRREQVKQLLIAILPDVEDIRFDAGSGPYPKPRVEFKTFSGWVPLRRLGYGYQTLIAWVTDFASRMVERYPDSPDPFKEPAIVLIDEIDLHLHPIWQRKLIAFLTERFPNTQFIATAHSPLVVQAAENANIAVLKRVGDHVEIINDPERIRGWRIDQILTSDLFGLKTASPPAVEALYDRKQELLKKAKLSASDKKELSEIQEKIDKLPVGDSARFAKEMEAMQKALALLKDHQPK
jgi:energy-coupling factor transporter ATP-binding protein EcfA2